MFTHSKKNGLILLVTIFVALMLLPSQPASADGTTFVVNSTGLLGDSSAGDGVCSTGSTIIINGQSIVECTLRAAIEEANFTPALDNIHFDIRESNGSCPTSAKRITLTNTSQYVPAYTFKGQNYAAFYVTRPINIDGYTQCNSSPNSQADGTNSVIRIELRGSTASQPYAGIVLHGTNSSGSTIRGLSMTNFGRGQISIVFSGNHIIEGNYLGLYATGAAGAGNIGVFFYGGTHNIIGGSTLAARNHIAGLGNDGIHMEDFSSHNQIIGNYFGLAPDGLTRRANGSDMIDFQAGTTNNWIGGIILDGQGNPVLDGNGRTQADPHKRNIMSGGNGDAIELTHPTENGQNHIVGNWLGLNAFGNTTMGNAIGNGHAGINIEDHFNGNFVYQNIIVNNGSNGLVIWASDNNHIYDNWIGIRPAGQTLGGIQFGEALMGNGPTGRNLYSTAVSKGIHGIYMLGGSDNNIIERNYIADNGKNSVVNAADPGYGIYLSSEVGWGNSDDAPPSGDPESDSARCSHQRNRISQNSMYGNHHFQGIRLKDDVTCPLMHSFGMQPPSILSGANNSNTNLVTVTSLQKIKDGNGIYQDTPCANCTIEIFINSDVAGAQSFGLQGKTYVASGTTDSAGKAIVIFNSPLPDGTNLVATAIDPLGNTSQFSQSVRTVNIPSCAGAPAAATLSVAKTGQNVQLSWNSISGTQFYRVYRSTDPSFTPSTNNLVAQVNTGTSYTDVNALADTTNQYYVIQAVNSCLQASAASNRVGEVALPILPGQNLISLPVVPSQTSIGDLLGAQLNGTGNPLTADQVRTYNNITKKYDIAWYCAAECEAWGAPWANSWLKPNYTPSTMQLTPGMGFLVTNRGQETKYIKVVGNVATALNVNVYGKSNMLGASFPTSRTPAQLNLPATGGPSSGMSNTIRYWNAATQSEQSAWFCDCPANPTLHNQWVDPQTSLPTTMIIQPGTGFWYDNVTNDNFVWQSQ
ncbi:MAG: right-handed parallel beta-helix repeat-containing protein [Chloroflexi bacterium]|nr:right-handed parallel beta-helix repeat-containing protein [Chloroflexota bacterium]